MLASPSLGVAALGVGTSGPQDITLYDTSDPSVTNAATTSFPTPGVARSVAIYNGIAYVADSNAGLQVVNYLSFDAQGIPARHQRGGELPPSIRGCRPTPGRPRKASWSG